MILDSGNHNISRLFDDIYKNIETEIKNLNIIEIDAKGKKSLSKELYEKYHIKNLVEIKFDDFIILKEEISEDKLYDLKQILFEYKIPFIGNGQLLIYGPHSCIYQSYGNNNMIRISNNFIVINIYLSFDELDDVVSCEELVYEKIKYITFSIEKNLDYLNTDIKNFNKNLLHHIEICVSEYYTNLEKKKNIMKSIKLETIVKESAPNIKPIKLDLVETKTVNNKMYYIDDKTYENIINIIDIMGISMEKVAYSFRDLDEENLRDLLLVILNSHYERKATGETFRRRGKTDILIESETNDAYVAECKLWAGESVIGKAISQLSSYRTWRDTKTSIIFFNKKNKNFKNTLNTIDKFFKDKKDKRIVSYTKSKDNVWQCKLKTKDNTIIDLHFVIYDLYSNKVIK